MVVEKHAGLMSWIANLAPLQEFVDRLGKKMNTMNAIKIILIVGMVIALVAVFINVPYVTFALIVLGLVLGFMGIGDSDRLLYLMVAVTLATVAGSLDVVPEVGNLLTAFLENVSAMISAAAIVVVGRILAARITS